MQQTCEKNAGLRHRSRVRILNASALKVKPPPPGHNCISFTWPVVYASNKSGGERRLHYIRALTCRNCLFFFLAHAVCARGSDGHQLDRIYKWNSCLAPRISSFWKRSVSLSLLDVFLLVVFGLCLCLGVCFVSAFGRHPAFCISLVLSQSENSWPTTRRFKSHLLRE